MPRIPIPQYQQQQRTPLETPAARIPMIAVEDSTARVLDAATRGLQQYGAEVEKGEAAAKKVEEEDARAWVSKAVSDDRIKWAARLAEMKDSSGPGAPDFTPGVLNEYDAYSQRALEAAPEFAKRYYNEHLMQQRTALGLDSVAFEAQQKRAHTISQYKQGAQSDAAAIALAPDQYGQIRAARMGALATSTLPEAQRQRLTVDAEQDLAFAAGAAMVDRDPRASLAAFDQAQGGNVAPGFEWIGRMEASRIQQLRHRAMTQSDRLDTKERVEAGRLEARGQRAIQEMEKQADSGIPATPQFLEQQRLAVQGTPYAAEYESQVAWMGTVQDVLRRSIPEQQQFVMSERRRLLTQGGSQQEARNVERLAGVVERNIKDLREAPLTWLSNRTGQQFAPLQFEQLGTPDGVAAFGTQLRERADLIRGLQSSQPEGFVAMNPLMPAEAEMLSQALSKGGAQQQRMLLGSLYRAAGDQRTYSGMMAQLNGVSPFMARMGSLAASFDQAKLTDHYFSKDFMQSAGDVAAIALHGDSLMRAGGKDGDFKFPMPKEEEFRNGFQSLYTTPYRGAGPGDSGGRQLLEDMRAVKAYYVGRAAQDGDFSGVVDGERMKQAFRAVMGEAVDFHGNGQVLAPWGMNAEDFRARANKALVELAQTRPGMSEKLMSNLRNVGLIGVGGGHYFVTLGPKIASDDEYRPLTFSLRPDGEIGRDSFGRSLGDMIPRTANPVRPDEGQP